MRWPVSLRGRVTLAALSALLLVLVVVCVALLASVARDGRATVDSQLQQRADRLVAHLTGPFRNPGGPPDDGPGLLAGSGTFVQLVVGRQIYERTGDAPSGNTPVPAGQGYSTVSINGQSWRALSVSLPVAGRVRLQVFSTLAGVSARVARLRRLIVLFGLLGLVLTGAAVWALSTWALRPLERLRDGASRVSGTDDLRTRLPEPTAPEEVAALAASLNGMLGRLEESSAATARALEATRRFAADAGHELRTPLTAMQANLEVLRHRGLDADSRDAVLADMADEQERIVRLLEALQTLARGEAADALPRRPVDLDDLADAAVMGARRRHPATHVALDLDPEGATVDGWPEGLRILVDNLLENAALHGRPGGRVELSVRRDGPRVRLAVDDDGPGIPEAERERVRERFVRGENARAPGSGLGLSLVAQQAALHGGSLRLDDSALGGLRAEVTLPLAPGGGGPEPPAPEPAPLERASAG